ncbi:hypothetical protein SELMODRAFT_410472 [Selaginella moellendorffii]|uniref:Tubby C-terminal domain-containing protein n=1 Tax=Selaginella moellendorffii TaxID=88036 RepID=D8REV3_SELML|nr:hypothetical protein SELMODRAFT_410472 [Selaginella moellendorffii]
MAVAALPVAGSQFCDFQAVDLTLSSSGVFSCGKYTVRDAEQNQVFAVDGKFGCGRQRRVMDSSGKLLLVLQKVKTVRQACSFQNKWKVYLDEDKLLFTTKRPFFFRLELCVDVYLGENTTPDFKLTGSAFTGKYCLHRTDTGELIAKARSKRNLACVASYSIEIEPGVDSLFVVSMILTIVGRSYGGHWLAVSLHWIDILVRLLVEAIVAHGDQIPCWGDPHSSSDMERLRLGKVMGFDQDSAKVVAEHSFETSSLWISLSPARESSAVGMDGNFGCGRQRRVMDSSGKVILVLHKEAFSFQSKWKAYLDEDKFLFTAKKPCFRLELCVDVYLGESTTPDFKLTGCDFTGKYSLRRTDTGQLIAKARYKWKLASIAGCHSYSIEIELGVDSLFVVSMFLVMNEI